MKNGNCHEKLCQVQHGLKVTRINKLYHQRLFLLFLFAFLSIIPGYISPTRTSLFPYKVVSRYELTHCGFAIYDSNILKPDFPTMFYFHVTFTLLLCLHWTRSESLCMVIHT